MVPTAISNCSTSTALPHQRVVLALRDVDSVIDGTLRLAVRGAPAIGVAAAYGLVLGVRNLLPLPQAMVGATRDVASRLLAARPTAVNLQWASNHASTPCVRSRRSSGCSGGAPHRCRRGRDERLHR